MTPTQTPALHDELRARLAAYASAVAENALAGYAHVDGLGLRHLRDKDTEAAEKAAGDALIAALTLPASEAVAELVSAATDLRQRQRDYLSGPKSERSEEKGRLVGVAAARVDAALAALSTPASDAVAFVEQTAPEGLYARFVDAGNMDTVGPGTKLFTTPQPAPATHAGGEALTRQQVIDLWMQTDADHAGLFDHLQRFATALLSGGAAREEK